MGTHILGLSTVDLRDKDVLVIIDGKESSRTVSRCFRSQVVLKSISIIEVEEELQIFMVIKRKTGLYGYSVTFNRRHKIFGRISYKIDAYFKKRD